MLLSPHFFLSCSPRTEGEKKNRLPVARVGKLYASLRRWHLRTSPTAATSAR